MQSDQERAATIALDVLKRRGNGETILDADVISRHPEIADSLRRELDKVRVINAMREQAEPDESEFDPRFTTVLPAGGDARATCLIDSHLTGQVSRTIGEPAPAHGGGSGGGATAERHDGPTIPFRPSKRPPMAHLDVCHDYQNTFTTVALRKDRNVIGRMSGEVLIEHDKQISSRHAEITREKENDGWRWWLRDLESKNGTYVMIERAVLKNGDELLIGSNNYRFTQIGTEVCWEHIVGGEPVDGLTLDPDGTWIGRDRCDDLEAFADGLLDLKHALISLDRKNRWSIKNAGSLNGIWYRITQVRLRPHAAFQLGEQRFVFRG
ncbi:FHA domain-containing protein [Neorhodopirellula pilleata]|uniref:FHA domain protein n=1 Tax=Neorhodopirellula pilleata TaxID=2714738 RepID=A0A5C6AX09_9BACT|nr:FHA domain-containing protein [Neorhodopirellula pilleata]TWU03689.1 FHA domain protein [Neorhodopirellula pilleata]